ncbi:hypothetical protein BRADI_4g00713v3 [Brachypodium distachyon]|uniref:DUF4219 domain-containing protein n=1 Tax=Brachypodium distachyon TaxID=15368 RepID=A0A2K2CJR1_BRADI|nr:hypothetical protein BRADI_4g00713v3 [Brachypodium distachyon]PNT62269.1 hypothetical protein BRADI_4g00713v3 [Brachypodium distachyon]
MPRDADSSPSKAIVPGGSGDSATTAIAAAGRLPFPMLTTTNYAAWALRMRYILRVNGAWGAVDPENSSKVIDESKEELAMTIISQSIDDGTLLRVAEKENAADVWAALRSMHVGVEHVREARIQSLRSEFDRLKMGDAESVDDFAASALPCQRCARAHDTSRRGRHESPGRASFPRSAPATRLSRLEASRNFSLNPDRLYLLSVLPRVAPTRRRTSHRHGGPARRFPSSSRNPASSSAQSLPPLSRSSSACPSPSHVAASSSPTIAMNSAHGAPAPGYLSSPIASPAPSTTSSISQLHYSTAAWPAKVISFKFGKESRRHCLVVAVEPQSLKLSPHCRHPFSPAAGDELHHQEPLDLEVHHWRMRKGPLEPLHHSPPASEPSIAAARNSRRSTRQFPACTEQSS